MEIKLPLRVANESISEHDARCGAVLTEAFTKLGIDPDSVYPTAIGGMNTSESGDVITMNVTMSYEKFNTDDTHGISKH